MSFALGKTIATRVRLYVPGRGVASADVELADATVLSGEHVLYVGDLACKGVVVDGGPVAARARYEWKAGKGAWGNVIPAKGFGNSQGVQRSALIRDAALACGEPVNVALPEARLGIPPAAGYARLAGPAWDILRALAVPWHVDPAGVTQIAERPVSQAPVLNAVLLEWDREEGRRVYVPDGEGIAGWLPGARIDGEQIISLQVDAREGEPIRLTVYTRQIDGGNHDPLAAIDELIRQRLAPTRFHGAYRYTVASRQGLHYGLKPVRADLGLPTLGSAAEGAPIGVDQFWACAGHDADLPVGCVVAVSFLDGDPAEPFITGIIRPDERIESTIPINSRFNATARLDLAEANALVAREDDPVNGLVVTASQDSSTGTVVVSIFDNAQPLANAIGLIITSAGLVSVLGASVMPEPPKTISVQNIGHPTQEIVRA